MIDKEDNDCVKKVIMIQSFLFSSELWFCSYPTKSKFDYLCGLYSRRSSCLSCNINLSVCPNLCLSIALPFTSTLVGGGVKGYFIIVQPNFACHLGLFGIIGFTILLQHIVITRYAYLVYTECSTPPPMIGGTFMCMRLTYFWGNKSYLLILK